MELAWDVSRRTGFGLDDLVMNQSVFCFPGVRLAPGLDVGVQRDRLSWGLIATICAYEEMIGPRPLIPFDLS
jgi:hypothetical protein